MYLLCIYFTHRCIYYVSISHIDRCIYFTTCMYLFHTLKASNYPSDDKVTEIGKALTCTALFRKQLLSPGALSNPLDMITELVFLGVSMYPAGPDRTLRVKLSFSQPVTAILTSCFCLCGFKVLRDDELIQMRLYKECVQSSLTN